MQRAASSMLPASVFHSITLQALFTFKMGWTYGKGPGCTENRIGDYINRDPGATKNVNWRCMSGCGDYGTDPMQYPIVGDLRYYCTAASQADDWEQGEKSFNYTFPGLGPYTIA